MPLSKSEKDRILKRLRANYDFTMPPDTKPIDETIALLERRLEIRKSQVEAFLAKGNKDITKKEIETYETNLQSISENERTILALRKPNWRNRTRSFAKNTKMDVAQIVCDGLNLNVKDQDKRYKKHRESYGLTYEEVAEIIGVHRKNIKRLEISTSDPDDNAANTVDPFYLEALSLIYHKDPYTLLGLQPALITVLHYAQITHADYIMNTLTAYPNDQKVKYIQTFGKIATLTKKQFDMLCQLLEYIPAFKRISSSQKNIRCEHYFLQHPIPNHFPINKRNSPDYKRAELIQEVFFELKVLLIKNPDKLRKLAFWASGGENILEILYALLILGEFPERKDSVRPSAFDEEYGLVSPHYVASRRRAEANEHQKEAASQVE